MKADAKMFFESKTEKLLELIGQELVNTAKRYCPVGKYTDGRVGGRLRGSITYATNKVQSEITIHGNPSATENDKIKQPTEKNVVRVGSAVEYAPYVEFGTKNMGNTPFLRTALHTARIKELIHKAGFKK